MSLVLGCIADDFTGATDLCNTLVRQGMPHSPAHRCSQGRNPIAGCRCGNGGTQITNDAQS